MSIEADEIYARIKKAEKWFDNNSDIDKKIWDEAFELYRKLLRKYSNLKYGTENKQMEF